MSLDKNELVSAIARRREILISATGESPINTDPFRRLLSILVRYSETVPAKSIAFHLEESHLQNFDFDAIGANLKHFTPALQTSNLFLVNDKFEILQKESYDPKNTVEANETYKSLSKNKHCLILLFNNIPTVYYNEITEGGSTFTAEADLKRYDERKDLTSLFEVLAEYKEELKKQNVYYKFFVDKVTLIKLYGKDTFYPHRNLLRNKPENSFREDLREFLSRKIRQTFNFSRENQLDSGNRMDINAEDELGNYYFLEIKWLGKSIHPDGTKSGTEFDEKSVFDGFEQTVKYIHELKTQNKSVKVGCLVIFDARDNKTALTYEWERLDSYLQQHQPIFNKIDDFHVNNEHPR